MFLARSSGLRMHTKRATSIVAAMCGCFSTVQCLLTIHRDPLKDTCSAKQCEPLQAALIGTCEHIKFAVTRNSVTALHPACLCESEFRSS